MNDRMPAGKRFPFGESLRTGRADFHLPWYLGSGHALCFGMSYSQTIQTILLNSHFQLEVFAASRTIAMALDGNNLPVI